MAISFITANGTTTSAAGPATVSITPTGNTSLIVAGAQTYNGATTGITYNGNAMTQIFNTQPTTNRYVSFYYYLNGVADGAAHNVSFSYSGSSGGEFIAGAYDGVKQSGVPDASNSNEVATSTSNSVSVTTVADNCWLISFADSPGTATQAAGTSTTQRNLQTNYDDWGLYDSNAAKSPAGSYSLAVTWTSSGAGHMDIISIAPNVAAAASSLSTLSLLKVG